MTSDLGAAGRPAWVEIDLDAIRHNVHQLRRLLPRGVRFMAVIKADAYGHGAVPVARAALAAGAEWLGVALVEEALVLRQAGITAPILVFAPLRPEAADLYRQYGLRASVTDLAVARAAAGEGRPVKVHLKVDTGMGRIGVLPDDVPDLLERLRTIPGLEVEGIYTHFSTADDWETDHFEQQRERFSRLLRRLEAAGRRPPLAHMANSAALLRDAGTAADMVRIGAGIYGIVPPQHGLAPVPLRPALAIKAKIVQVRRIPAGWKIGYGATYVAPRPSTLGIVPVGYADGYDRGLSNRAHVLIRGRRMPIVGRVCMDQLIVDAGDADIAVGDEVVLLGRQGQAEISALDLADWAQTIPDEIVSRLGSRLPRRYPSPIPQAMPRARAAAGFAPAPAHAQVPPEIR